MSDGPFIDRFQMGRYPRGLLTKRRYRWSIAEGRRGRRMMDEMGYHPLRSVRRPHGKWHAIGSRSRIMLRRLDAMRKRFAGGFLPYRIYGRLTNGWLYFKRKNPDELRAAR